MWKRKVRNILRSQLDRARAGDAPYSMRDLARRLDLSSGALSELLSGKRKLSPNIAKKLVLRMVMSDEERADVLRDMEARPSIAEKLDPEQIIELICNWEYFAIFALLDLDHPPRSAADVSQRLQISAESAGRAWDRLNKLGLIEKSIDGTYRVVASVADSAEKLSDEFLRTAHEKNFRLALSVLDLLKPSDHEFSTLTFAGSKEQLEAAKTELKRLREKLPVVMSAGTIDEIYQLNIQLFPLKNWHASPAEKAILAKSDTPN